MTYDLDHVGVAVRDLDAAGEAWRRLGFTLTEKSFHYAPPSPGAAPVRSGTGNHCVMLRRGYLELIAATDPNYRGRLIGDLARYEGLHLIALGTTSAADAAIAMSKATGETISPASLGRPFTERGRNFEARFSIVAPPANIEGAYVFGIEHQTREALWQPHLLDHANGAISLEAVVMCVAAPRDAAARIAKPFGATVQGATVMLDPGGVEILDSAGFAASYSGASPPGIPSIAAMRLGVKDIATTQAFLADASIPIKRSAAGVFVPASEATGAIVEFVAV